MRRPVGEDATSRLPVLLLALCLPACATVTSGTSQGVTVVTEPPGATCELRRDGSVVGVVNPTPGTVQISKSSRDMAIRCSRSGSFARVQVVQPEFQSMTVGNIPLGGVIGLAVDAASGAMAQYPATVTMVLAPRTFASAGERDAFFDTQVAEVRRTYEGRIAAAIRDRPPGDPDACEARRTALEAERDAEVARLEEQRSVARAT